MDSTIQHYYELVKSFSAFVEELVISEDRLEELMLLLLQLYEKDSACQTQNQVRRIMDLKK